MIDDMAVTERAGGDRLDELDELEVRKELRRRCGNLETWELEALGMETGDELYWMICAARDRVMGRA